MLHKKQLAFVMLVMAGFAMAQEWWEKKPYTAWTGDEVNNMLDKSPWGRVYTQPFPVAKDIQTQIGQRAETQTIEQHNDRVQFHLFFVTARPVRMAVARRKMLADPGKASPAELEKYIDQGDDHNIVLLMSLSSNPPQCASYGAMLDLLDSLKTADLADSSYLSTDRGKKVSLVKYDPYGENGFGVKLHFPRELATGGPLVTADDKEIRFETVIALPVKATIRSVRIRANWNLKKMAFSGRLEI